jgi:hypothetical protein
MTPNSSIESSDLHVSRYDYGDRWVVAVDVGDAGIDEGVVVDLVGEEAVVAVDVGGLKTEFDLDLPDGDAEYELRNGVLVIEGTR